jgi:hypothetical protein
MNRVDNSVCAAQGSGATRSAAGRRGSRPSGGRFESFIVELTQLAD